MVRLQIRVIMALGMAIMGGHAVIEAAAFGPCSIERNIDATAVFMDDGAYIEMTSDQENQKKSLFSFAFGGCTGVVLYVLLKDGKQRAALTHYPSMNEGEVAEHVAKIRELGDKLMQQVDANEIIESTAIIFHPEHWKKRSKKDKVPQDPVVLASLKKAIQECAFKRVIEELYVLNQSSRFFPAGMYENRIVPKELEIVLCANSEESYIQSKATRHKKQILSNM